MSSAPNSSSQAERDLPGLLHVINNEILMLQRAMAGYNLLASVLSQAERPLQQGERRRGLPIFKYAAPDAADGSKVIEIVSDLKRLDPAYLGHVLSPLANMHAAEMAQSVKRIYQASGEMLSQIEQALCPQQTAVGEPGGFAPPSDPDDAIYEEGEEVGVDEVGEEAPPVRAKVPMKMRKAQG